MGNTKILLMLLTHSFLSDEGESTPETKLLSLHQTCDFTDVLTRMSAELAEQKVKMEQLREENQAQVAELNALKARSTVTESKVEALTQERTVKHVAFSTALIDSGEKTLGPFNAETTIVYKHVASNIGNYYSTETGMFTAPVRGVYHFEIFALSMGDIPVDAYLRKNGQGVFMAHESQPSGHGTGGNAVTLLLEAGDVVYVTLPPNRRLFDNKNHHNTFSGHLLFTMENSN
ncbi:complement C1q-like protein 3 [Boleophthalmus pectinirostris]|uniref:complement C1q-like protein 3 n=1 Tax=Boleophthalmus pectinirostris TaxID=150288 RepID=UPI00242DCBC2|nr:complement C1q-like protein 3 [Boleophthalmus pectinirostris]